jgi:AcrR family transcriptional regulator
MSDIASREELPETEVRRGNAIAQRDRVMTQRVVAAAAACIDRLGLEQTSIDVIAVESGVSRATLYRKFGNKEGILLALITARSEPFESRSVKILMGVGSLGSRVERAMIRAVLDMPEQLWFGELMRSEAVGLFSNVYRQRARAVLGLVLQSEEARRDLELEDVVEWGLRELADMVAARPWNERRLRMRIRRFILPVLIPDRFRSNAGA